MVEFKLIYGDRTNLFTSSSSPYFSLQQTTGRVVAHALPYTATARTHITRTMCTRGRYKRWDDSISKITSSMTASK